MLYKERGLLTPFPSVSGKGKDNLIPQKRGKEDGYSQLMLAES